MSPRDSGLTGDVIIELPDGEGIGTLLDELSLISPQVFVSSVSEPPLPAEAQPLRDSAPIALAVR
jgi:hypothetical protein